jgi:hypothetical protein
MRRPCHGATCSTPKLLPTMHKPHHGIATSFDALMGVTSLIATHCPQHDAIHSLLPIFGRGTPTMSDDACLSIAVAACCDIVAGFCLDFMSLSTSLFSPCGVAHSHSCTIGHECTQHLCSCSWCPTCCKEEDEGMISEEEAERERQPLIRQAGTGPTTAQHQQPQAQQQMQYTSGG